MNTNIVLHCLKFLSNVFVQQIYKLNCGKTIKCVNFLLMWARTGCVYLFFTQVTHHEKITFIIHVYNKHTRTCMYGTLVF